MMIRDKMVAAPAVCQTRPPMPTPMTATRLTATAPNNMAPSTPGCPMATAACCPAKIRCPSSNPITLPSRSADRLQPRAGLGDDFQDLAGQLPGCHATPWPSAR
jgi:hypothetical protein